MSTTLDYQTYYATVITNVDKRDSYTADKIRSLLPDTMIHVYFDDPDVGLMSLDYRLRSDRYLAAHIARRLRSKHLISATVVSLPERT